MQRSRVKPFRGIMAPSWPRVPPMSLKRIRFLPGVLTLLALTACGINPVTGKREIQFVSEAQELQIGEQQYAPTRQSEGGDYKVLPDLTAYVNEVGQKL